MLCQFVQRFLFQSTLPARGATSNAASLSCGICISIHAPRTGSDAAIWGIFQPFLYFNPRSPHGERLAPATANGWTAYFNPRSPHGERPFMFCCTAGCRGISIHAPRTGSDVGADQAVRVEAISIHAPRTGSDQAHQHHQAQERISIHAPRTGSDADQARPLGSFAISIHAPRTGSDTLVQSLASLLSEFQSTLPARGATAGAPAD